MNLPLKDRAARAIAECYALAAFTEEPGCITRRFLTPPVHAVHAHLRARMESLGMSVRTDAIGNLRALHQPANAAPKRLLIGSHIDTVPNAGPFDGILGVTLALELVEIAAEQKLPLAIEVIAFSEEEGVRYGVPFFGSRAVAGIFNPAHFDLKDANGITVSEAIRVFGLNPEEIPAAQLDTDTAAFFEIHIEQGPVLESENLSVAAVSAIAGQTRGTLLFTGQANHAGTTPLPLRRDALAAAAEWITFVEAIARRTPELAATVGQIAVEPNASNVVPSSARLSLDLRHPLDHIHAASLETILAETQSIAQRRSLTAAWTGQMSQPAVPMDERLTSYLADALTSAGHPAKIMTSGAGHDAMVLAARVPTAMLFLRSPGGISHHPSESVREEDIEAALRVATEFLKRLAAENHL